jgi:hypothetical protein
MHCDELSFDGLTAASQTRNMRAQLDASVARRVVRSYQDDSANSRGEIWHDGATKNLNTGWIL